MGNMFNRLICLNTKFQKIKGKLWTYTYTNNAKVQIDYILMNKKWNDSARHIHFSKVCPPITELSWLTYDWAYTGMWLDNKNCML